MNVLFVIEVEVLVLIEWSYRSLESCFYTELTMVIIF